MRFLFAIVLCLCLIPRGGESHPHAWIDMETTVLFSETGAIEGVRVGWLFDDFYSAFSLDGLEGTQQQLNELADINIKNLSEFDYFTRIRLNGEDQTFLPVTRYETALSGNRLWLEFDVMLASPIVPSAGQVQYSVFDPTYYVQILHAEQGDPIRLTGNAGDCGYQLQGPQPPDDIALLAQAMDQTETMGPTIGHYFAETVDLSCS